MIFNLFFIEIYILDNVLILFVIVNRKSIFNEYKVEFLYQYRFLVLGSKSTIFKS